MGVKRFEDAGRWVNGQGGEGFIIDLDAFDQLWSDEKIVDVNYETLGRNRVEDVYGNIGYFYPIDLEVA